MTVDKLPFYLSPDNFLILSHLFEDLIFWAQGNIADKGMKKSTGSLFYTYTWKSDEAKIYVSSFIKALPSTCRVILPSDQNKVLKIKVILTGYQL